jgi:hypothetical protein
MNQYRIANAGNETGPYARPAHAVALHQTRPLPHRRPRFHAHRGCSRTHRRCRRRPSCGRVNWSSRSTVGTRNSERAIDGLETALAGLGLLEQALALDLRKPQDYFQRVWATAFRATDLAATTRADNGASGDDEEDACRGRSRGSHTAPDRPDPAARASDWNPSRGSRRAWTVETRATSTAADAPAHAAAAATLATATGLAVLGGRHRPAADPHRSATH